MKKPKNHLVESTRQDHAHQHSASIRSKRLLLEFEAEQVANRVVSLRAALSESQARARRLAAMIEGLGDALKQRG